MRHLLTAHMIWLGCSQYLLVSLLHNRCDRAGTHIAMPRVYGHRSTILDVSRACACNQKGPHKVI